MRGQLADGGHGVAHPVEDHVGGVEVDAHVRVRDVGERAEQRVGALLARLECDAHAARGEDVGHGAQARDHGGALGVVAIVWQEAGMQRDERNAVVTGDGRGGTRERFVLRPRGRGADAARALDGLQRGVVLAHGGQHAAHHGDAARAQALDGGAPDGGLLDARHQRQLHRVDAAARERVGECVGRFGTEAPGTGGNAAHGVDSTRFPAIAHGVRKCRPG